MHNYDLEVQDAIETTPKCRISVLDLFPVFPRNKIILILIFLSDFMVLLGHDVKEATLLAMTPKRQPLIFGLENIQIREGLVSRCCRGNLGTMLERQPPSSRF